MAGADEKNPARIIEETGSPQDDKPSPAITGQPPGQPEAEEEAPELRIEPVPLAPTGSPVKPAAIQLDDDMPAGSASANPQTGTAQQDLAPPGGGDSAGGIKKGRLSKIWSFVASAGIGAAIGIASKTLAGAAFTTAGAPAAAAAIAGMVAAGIAVGAYKAYTQARKENPEASFLAVMKTKKTWKSIGIHTAFSVAAGSLFLVAGDEIFEAGKKVFESIFGSSGDSINVVPVPVPTDQSETINSLQQQLAEAQQKLAGEHAARTAAEQKLAAAQQQLVQEHAAREAAEREAARLAAEQEAARIAAEQEAARVAAGQEAARIAAEQEAARLAAEQEAARLAALTKTHIVARGDNLWDVVKAHYGLTGNADIQRYVDGVAAANDMTAGTAANNIAIGAKITLPPAEVLQGHKVLALDWKALDAQTAQRLASPRLAFG